MQYLGYNQEIILIGIKASRETALPILSIGANLIVLATFDYSVVITIVFV